MKKTITILTIVLLLAGCGRKWKMTAPVTMEVDVVKSSENVDYLWFKQGKMHFERFSIEGDRKQSRDIGFEDVFEKSNTLDVRSETISVPLQYDLQQGTYTELDVFLRLDQEEGSTENTLELIGTYHRLDGNYIPVKFEFDERIDLKFDESFPNDADEFSLVSGQDYIAILSIDVMDWFATISQDALEGAEISEIPGSGEGILINRDVNSQIFDEIISRVGESESLVFQ